MTEPNILKPAFLALPQARLRSTTISSPLITPIEGLSAFLSDEEVRDLLHSEHDHFSRLPTELKTYVFTFISALDKIRYQSVSKEWQKLLKDGSQWQVLDVSSFPCKIPIVELERLIRQNSAYIQHLSLRGCSQIRSSVIASLQGLSSASLENCRGFSSRSLVSFFSRNDTLRSLDLAGVSAVTDQTLEFLSTICNQLVYVNLNHCNVSASVLHRFVQSSALLRDLRIAALNLNLDLMLAIHNLEHLERLCLAGCPTLSDEHLKALIYGEIQYGMILPDDRVRRSLLHLDISQCTTLTNLSFLYMQYTLPLLQKLEIAGLPMLMDATLHRVLPTLSSLTHIDLGDCLISDITLTALTSCEQLRHIELSHCPNISEHGVLNLIDSLPLTHLDLDNTNITNEVLSAISTRERSMRVSIYDCPNVSWTGVLSILTANSANPTDLKRLKTFYGWQRPVDAHTKRILNGNIAGARDIEREWTTYMMESTEKSMKTGEGRTRFLDFEDEGTRIVGRSRRRKMLSMSRCSLM